jgi:hypothetical protein
MNSISLIKNKELMLLTICIFIAFSLYYFLIKIETFYGDYIPQSKLGYKPKDKIKGYPLYTYDDYIKIEKKIRNKHKEKGSNVPLAEVSDLNWKIHRWSMWDYLPDIKKNYYCKVEQYNGEEVCMPLSNKQYCSIDKLFEKPIDCLKSIKNES